MARPSPEPERVSPAENAWNKRLRSSSGMPGPLSHQRGNARIDHQPHAQGLIGGAVTDGVVEQVAAQLTQHPVMGANQCGLGRNIEIQIMVGDQGRQIQRHFAQNGGPVGAPFGCIPAGGTEIPTFLSYAAEKKLAKAKNLEEFGGKGAIEGVAGPEAANKATVTAALIPLLHIGNVMLLVLNLPLVGLWVKRLKLPKPQLYAGILIFATVGAYGMCQSAFDLFLLYAIGLLGLVMPRFSFPTEPVVVSMILGSLAEAQLRNARSIGEGRAMVFLQRPMSLALLIVVLSVLILSRLLRRRAAPAGWWFDCASVWPLGFC